MQLDLLVQRVEPGGVVDPGAGLPRAVDPYTMLLKYSTVIQSATISELQSKHAIAHHQPTQ